MKKRLKLYMVMLGCTPQGRLTEQHDVFFGIASSLKELTPSIHAFWSEAKGNLHIDAWREVTAVDDFLIEVVVADSTAPAKTEKLFFINLGGYKENEFEEYHCKILKVTKNATQAIKDSKKSSFYKYYGFKGAPSHIDEKHEIDVDNIHEVATIVYQNFDNHYALQITKATTPLNNDVLHVGYVKINKKINVN